MKTGIELITEERQKQIDNHGFTNQHDVYEYNDYDLPRVILALACHPTDYYYYNLPTKIPIPGWGQKLQQKFKDDNIHRLKVAGALIAAEIDRLQSKSVISY